MSGTHGHTTTGFPRTGVVVLGVRPGTWQRDYAICGCRRTEQDCPHCGEPRTDNTHRGRCHARTT